MKNDDHDNNNDNADNNDDIAWRQEHATQPYSCHGVFIDRFTLTSNLLWMGLPWERHNQSQDTNWRHCVIRSELLFFHKRKGILKIDQSVKMLWHGLSIGVASSCSSTSDGSDDDNDDDDYDDDDDGWWRWQQFLLMLLIIFYLWWPTEQNGPRMIFSIFSLFQLLSAAFVSCFHSSVKRRCFNSKKIFFFSFLVNLRRENMKTDNA